MPASAAQIAANRKNSERSTGPRTAEGKERSRANSLRHGLTGSGVVVAPEEAAAVAERAALLEAELRPSGELGRILVRRAALLSHRMERCGGQELAATALRVRSAAADFDEARATALDDLFGRVEAEPAAVVRRLERTTAGVDRLIEGWLGLLEDLEHPSDVVWEAAHWARAEALGGRSAEAFPLSPFTRWHLAYQGKPALLLPGEAEGLEDPEAVREWARDRMADQIAREVAGLREHRETLDDGDLELDRAEAPARALFDPSKEASLARKYEAAAERGMYRALRELSEHEAMVGPGPELGPGPRPPAEAPRGTLASFFPAREAASAQAQAAAAADRPRDEARAEPRAEVTAGRSRATSGGPSPGR